MMGLTLNNLGRSGWFIRNLVVYGYDIMI